MANTRKGVPAGWTWREDRGGAPRWIPGPALRKAGWKGKDLKDPRTGEWLDRGASITAAEAINAAVAGWRAGGLVDPAFVAIAPPGAVDKARPNAAALEDRRAIGALIDAFTGATDAAGAVIVKPSNEFAELKPSTQRDYRNKLKRLVDTLAGYTVLPSPYAPPAEQARYAEAVAEIRASSIYTLLTPAEEEEGEGALYLAYWALRNDVGLNMANGVMRTAGLWLNWCKKRRRVIKSNPCDDVDMTCAPGRLRPRDWHELKAMVAAAEALGYPSIADSIILGVDLSWSQADRLALTWGQISGDARVRTRRIKTNRPGETSLLESLGRRRLPLIRRRQASILGSEGATFTHVLVCETTKAPWEASHYRRTFAEIRAEAARTCPDVADFLDKDLRATAVGVAYNAGLSRVQIAGRTLHSLAQINTILDNHYGVISREVGDQGADLLDAYLEKIGVAL